MECIECGGACVTLGGRVIEGARRCEACARVRRIYGKSRAGEETMRSRVLAALVGRRLGTGQVAQLLGTDGARVSGAMGDLRKAGMVEIVGKRGRQRIWALTAEGELLVGGQR